MMANITNHNFEPVGRPLFPCQTSSMTISPLENQFDNAHSDTSTAFSVYHTTFLWVKGVLHATAYARDDRLAASRRSGRIKDHSKAVPAGGWQLTECQSGLTAPQIDIGHPECYGCMPN